MRSSDRVGRALAGRRTVLAVGTMILFATALSTACVAREDLITSQLLSDMRALRDRGDLPTATATATQVPATATGTPTRTPPEGRSYARVIRVWDGNTILLEGGHSVRYIGVNTPGAGMFRRPLEPFGREAAERSVELLEGKEVEIEADQADVDPTGIMLRYVYVDGEMVNEILLREGLARLAPFGANSRHASRLREAEAEARAEPIGVWTLATLTPRPSNTPTITPIPSDTPPVTATRPASPTVSPTPLRVVAPQAVPPTAPARPGVTPQLLVPTPVPTLTRIPSTSVP